MDPALLRRLRHSRLPLQRPRRPRLRRHRRRKLPLPSRRLARRTGHDRRLFLHRRVAQDGLRLEARNAVRLSYTRRGCRQANGQGLRMIDVHCHLLPAVDDGSKSWETTRAMLRVAAEDGITHIVCTPHANDEFPYDRPAHLALTAQAQEMAGEWPQLILGCDFHLSFDNIQ